MLDLTTRMMGENITWFNQRDRTTSYRAVEEEDVMWTFGVSFTARIIVINLVSEIKSPVDKVNITRNIARHYGVAV